MLKNIRLRMTVCAAAMLTTTIVFAALPDGWMLSGSSPSSYEYGHDGNVSLDGTPGFFLRSVEPVSNGFGTIMQIVSANDYVGKKVRLSGWMKSMDVRDWAGLWMRIDGPPGSQPLAFDNMQSRPVKGSTEWTAYEVVLDVPDQATALAFGFLLVGEGEVWVDQFSVDEVDSTYQSTDTVSGARPERPANLDFH